MDAAVEAGDSQEPVTRSSRRVVEAQEHATIDVPAELLMDRGVLRIYPEALGKNLFRLGLSGDRITIGAAGFVGLIPLNDVVTVEVRPRVPISNLARLLEVSNHIPLSLSPLVRGYAAADDALPSLIDAFARALLRTVDNIQLQGVLRRYDLHQAATSSPKGRISPQQTFRKHLARGRTHSVEAAWFESTVDHAVNRCIKCALWVLARRYATIPNRKGVAELRAKLNEALHVFEGAGLDLSLAFLRDPDVLDASRLPELRAYYRDAINIAKLVVIEKSVEFEAAGRDVSLASLVINMEEVFELYIRNTLATHFSLDPNIQILNGNLSAPSGGSQPLFRNIGDVQAIESRATPDVVVTKVGEGGRIPACVLDMKYKPVQRYAERDDINQVVCYAASYRSSTAILIYPRRDSGPSEVTCLGAVGPVSVYQYIVDLGAEDLAQEERRFCSAVRNIAAPDLSKALAA